MATACGIVVLLQLWTIQLKERPVKKRLDTSEKFISNKCAVNSAGRSPQLEYFEGWQNQLFSPNGFLYVAVSTEIKSSFKNLHTLTYIDSIIKNLSGEWR